MRIAVLSDATMPTPTPGAHGLGRVAHTVAEGLIARGHDVTLFAKQGSAFSGPLIMPAGAEGYDGERLLARDALQAHQSWNFDVFLDNGHLHYLSTMLPGLPVINVYHDIYQPHSPRPILLSEGQRAIMPLAFETARIIPNTLSADDYEPVLETTEPAYALFMGAISELKQPYLAIEACARFGCKLIIAGQPLTGKVPVTTASNIEYVGVVTGDYKASLYQHARVFLQLGVAESFGLTTLEAGLYGTPVVGWPNGGTLDLISYGVNGVLICTSGNDKVQATVDAIERAWNMRRDAVRAYAESLCNPDAQINLYEQALSDAARGAAW